MKSSPVVLLAMLAALTGCGGSSKKPAMPLSGAANLDVRVVAKDIPGKISADLDPAEARCATGSNLGGGRHRQMTLLSASGQTISFEIIEPLTFNCASGHPLVLHGHGFGGKRVEDPVTDPLVDRLRANGYAVISIDQRGFNESTGTVRVMDPDVEGRDLLQILDWAETHLDYLAHERRGATTNLVAGSVGGSYGGMYQLLLHNIDAQQRLDVLTPDITPNDLRDSLNPGNVIKSAWAALLTVGGEVGANLPLLGGLDPVIKETLLTGVLNNRINPGALPFFYYHSAQYFLDGAAARQDPALFLLASGGLVDAGTTYAFRGPPTPVDILFTQGQRDTLFNVSEGFRNFQGYRALGGDVRLMTHESGHILPLLQAAGGEARCGTLTREDAVIGFLNEKLAPPAARPLPAETQRLLDRLRGTVCLSLAADDRVEVAPADLRRTAPPIPFTSPATVSGLLANLVSLPVPTFVPLATSPGAVLAGVPRLEATLASVTGDATCLPQPADTGSPIASPITGCDATVYVGLGARRGMGQPRLIDEQVTPLRGLGQHTVPLVAIAERLAADEQLGLLIYGAHPQYFTSTSRDVLVPAVTLAGRVALPLR